MKKYVFYLFVISLFLGFNQKVNAAAFRELTEEEQQLGILDLLDENDRLLELSNGEFILGEVSVSSGFGRSATETTFNSFTNPNSISVEELKNMIEEDFNQSDSEEQTNLLPMTRGPIYEMRTYTLPYRGAVIHPFAHQKKGWYSMTGLYSPAANTGGPYLLFGSQGDSALIGFQSDAVATLTGRAPNGSGIFINKDDSRYYTGGRTMYSYSPRATGLKQILSVCNI